MNSNLLFRMHELGISPQERKVFFGQLLGMSDAISFTLGIQSIAVHKNKTNASINVKPEGGPWAYVGHLTF